MTEASSSHFNKKKAACLICIGLYLGLSSFITAKTLLAQSVEKAQKCVLILNIPRVGAEPRFKVSWTTENGLYRADSLVARQGTHAYDLRLNPDWRGRISRVVIDHDIITGKIKEPNLSEELDIFFAPEEWLAGTINFLLGHSLFGYSLNFFFLTLFVVISLSITVFKPFRAKVVLPLLITIFTCLWVVYDFRMIYDHIHTVVTIEKEKPQFRTFGETYLYMQQLSNAIGKDTWTMGNIIDWPLIKYALAEKKFLPAGPAQFVITQQADNITIKRFWDQPKTDPTKKK